MKNSQNNSSSMSAVKGHRYSNSQNLPLYHQNRMQQLKNKRIVYPQSTLNKIVFISNFTGNGFKRQNLNLYDVPAHIDLQEMIKNINSVCFNQWRESFQALQAEPLNRYDQVLSLIIYSIIIVIVVLVFLISPYGIEAIRYFAYIFLGFIVIGCIYSSFLMRQRRVDVNKDGDMVKAIKRQLMRLNAEEEKDYGDQVRYRWTCHRDCLWIACEFF